jgi:ABC-2 type transport system permease protein
MTSSSERAGNIYDLGYRHHDGPRLGRSYAVRALYLQGLRACFGLGRRPLAKIAPWGLAVLGLLPAAAQLVILAVAPGNFEIIKVTDYFAFSNVIVILFVAVVAPEITGRDQRHRTLSLYFSRALLRDDYALARIAALTTATLAVTLVPALVLFIGNCLGDDRPARYLRENWTQLPGLGAAGLLIAAVLAAAAVAIASHTARRTFAIGGIAGPLFVIEPVAVSLAEIAGRYFLLLSPFSILRGATLFIFNVDADLDDPLSEHPIPGLVYLASAIVLACAALGVALRRYRTVSA